MDNVKKVRAKTVSQGERLYSHHQEIDFFRLIAQVTSAKKALTRYADDNNWKDFVEAHRTLDVALAEAERAIPGIDLKRETE